VLPIWIFVAFIAALVIGSTIANAAGKLPTAEELQLRAALPPRTHEGTDDWRGKKASFGDAITR
jgi:hypothetical protein